MNREQKLELLRRVSEGVDDLVAEVSRINGSVYGDREFFSAAIRDFESGLRSLDLALFGRSERLPPRKPYDPVTWRLRKTA